MSAALILIAGIAVLVIGYFTYGTWLSRVWGVEPGRETPAHTMYDKRDYVPAKAPVLLGHHFSSIAGAGPINGPILAAVFGWAPVLLWVLLGGIFFGAAQDFASIYASIRHKGRSLGAVISENIGVDAKKLFLVFAYLTLLLVIAAFASIVAQTFAGFTIDVTGEKVYNAINGTAATVSSLFILLAVAFGYFVYRRGLSLMICSLAGIAGIVVCVVLGLNFPIYLSEEIWLFILAAYILVASVLPVWVLLQPRDYLSSFLLYAIIIAAVLGIFITQPDMNLPAFTGFGGLGGNGSLFPFLFITVACGAISGFHSLVGSGTTSKQLDREGDAKVIGYGGMLIECGLAIIALIAVGSLFQDGAMPQGTPTQIFAGGLAGMIAALGIGAGYETAYALIILAVSVFALTSLDTATRLARYMFQEFFLKDGQTYAEATGYRRVLTDPYFATGITVALGVGLGFGSYEKIWPLFGAANQLLAALALLALSAWLYNIGRKNRMLLIPMVFMLVVTMSALCVTFIQKLELVIMGVADGAAWLQLIITAVMMGLAVVLTFESRRTLKRQRLRVVR